MSSNALQLDTANSEQPLLWVDCEFTGLDIDKGHKIIEIGAVITNLALEEVDAYQSFVGYDWSYVSDHMDMNPWWTGRSEDRKRMKNGIRGAKAVDQVDADLADLVTKHFGEEQPPLCGNSVGNDKKHIDDQFKHLADKIHYQIIDVSSLKLLARKYRGIEYDLKTHKHFALDDIRESVHELRFLLTELRIVDLSRLAIQTTPPSSDAM